LPDDEVTVGKASLVSGYDDAFADCMTFQFHRIGRAAAGAGHGWHHTGCYETVCPLQLQPAFRISQVQLHGIRNARLARQNQT